MAENHTRPAWMSDPLVKDIPQRKLQFLEQLFAQGRGKNQKEMLPTPFKGPLDPER